MSYNENINDKLKPKMANLSDLGHDIEGSKSTQSTESIKQNVAL